MSSVAPHFPVFGLLSMPVAIFFIYHTAPYPNGLFPAVVLLVLYVAVFVIVAPPLVFPSFLVASCIALPSVEWTWKTNTYPFDRITILRLNPTRAGSDRQLEAAAYSAI